MNTLSFLKNTVKSIVMMMLVTILVLTPLVGSLTPKTVGKLMPTMEDQHASALINVGILENQKLNVSYNSANGDLSLAISGIVLANIGVLNTQKFVYQLPYELKPILENPDFRQNASIDFVESWSIGSISDTINGSSLVLDPVAGTVTGLRHTLIDLSLLPSVSATLTIHLWNLNMTKLPPSTDGKLEFYGLAADDSLIDLSILESEGSYTEIGTKLPAPTINAVSDVDTTVTGTGLPGTTVHIVTPGGSYQGQVDEGGTYSIVIPVQAAGTTITAVQINSEGVESETASIIVKGVILEFTVPNEILFQTTPLVFREMTIPREVPDWSITVHDTRGEGSKWKIIAQATGPLMSSDGHALNPDALVYVTGNYVYPLIDGVLIYEGTTGAEQDTTVQWNENEGILIKMTPQNLLQVETGVGYTATINWTLENAP